MYNFTGYFVSMLNYNYMRVDYILRFISECMIVNEKCFIDAKVSLTKSEAVQHCIDLGGALIQITDQANFTTRARVFNRYGLTYPNWMDCNRDGTTWYSGEYTFYGTGNIANTGYWRK